MANERKYVEVLLEARDLDTQSDGFKVAVLPSPAVGETQQPVSVPFRYQELEDALDDLERKRIDLSGLIALGEQLADRLLPQGPVRDLFIRAVNQAGQAGGVRLRLLIREPRLAQLPWEYCYLQMHTGEKDRRHFLVLNPQLSIVRHEALPKPHPEITGATPERLRMVALMANAEGYPNLKLKREESVIEQALSGWSVEGVTIDRQPFIQDATLDDLALALQKGCDLFHFAGHGIFEEKDIDPKTGAPTGHGSIVLRRGKDTNEPRLLAAGDLAPYLQQAGVRVAVFGACESGRRDGITAWTGVAPAVMERGVSAVIAMQYEVLDEHAIAFSKMFYSSLAAGLSVDEAVSAGRLAMLSVPGEDNVEWGVPVLYMRSPDGVIFPDLTARRSKQAEQMRGVLQQIVGIVESGGEVTGIRIKRIEGSAAGIAGMFAGFEILQKANVVKGRISAIDIDELTVHHPPRGGNP